MTWGKRATGRGSSYEKSEKKYKNKMCGESAWGKVIGKLKFIVNRYSFQIFLSLDSSEIETNSF